MSAVVTDRPVEPEAEAPRRRHRLELAAGAGAFLVCAAFSWRPEWSPSEAATVVVVRSDWPDAWRMSMDDAALGPYYLLTKAWATFSTSHLWLRLPSVLAAAAAVALLYVFVQRVAGARAAAISAGSLIVLPALTRYGADARPYTLAVLAVLVVVSCWWDHVETGRLATGWGTSAGIVLTGLAHAYALLVTVAILVAVVVAPMHGRRQDLRRTLLPLAGGFALLLPWLVYEFRVATGTTTPEPATRFAVLRGLVHLPTTGGPEKWALCVGIVSLGLAAAGCLRGWFERGRTRTMAVLAIVWLVVPPAALTLMQALTDKPGVVMRYWAFSLPALGIGIGLCLRGTGRRSAVVSVAALATLGLLSLPAHRAIRSPDALGGTEYVSLIEVMDLPQLASAPLLVRGPFYRAVLANDPAAAARVPLMADRPGRPLDLIHPRGYTASSRRFDAMVEQYPTVIVFEVNHPRLGLKGVSPQSFRSHRRHLKVYGHPDVLCTFYGERLGVFSQDAQAFPPPDAVQLAESIEGVDPHHIRCRPWSSVLGTP